jgi:hypothetical protein
MTKEDPRVVLKLAAAMEYVESTIASLSPRAGDRSVEGVELVNVKRDVRTNTADRRAAGFTEEEIAAVLRQEEQ